MKIQRMFFKKYDFIINKKGFTLVEALVSLAITAMLIAAMTALFTPFRTMINDISRDAYTDMVVQNICEYIQKSTHTANKTTITSDGCFSDGTFRDIKDNGEVKCLMISKNAGGKTRLYDITPNKNDSIKYSDFPIGNLENYIVFMEPYFNNKNYKIEFKKKTGGNYPWLEIKLEAYNSDSGGAYYEKATADKVHNFKFLNENAILTVNTETFNPDECIYILYN